MDAANLNVFCNGFPKSGNHALQKALELLGVPVEIHHEPFTGKKSTYSAHVFIKRDPRNVIVSWLRFNLDVVTQGKFLARFRKFQDRPLIEEMAEYEAWLGAVFVVAYEDLIASPATMQAIAKHVGVPYIAGAWENLPNHTRTWNAVRSDYRVVWTSDVEKAWAAEGGNELLARWGY